MRANNRLDSPLMHLPLTLCSEFILKGELNGESITFLHVKDNRKRTHHININQKLDKLTLIPLKTWGKSNKISVISFDFN